MDELDIKDISIILKNKKNDEEVRAIIDNKTGEYSIKSSNDISVGELIYFHKEKEFYSENYSLMKNFKKTEEYRIYIFCASYTSSIYITS